MSPNYRNQMKVMIVKNSNTYSSFMGSNIKIKLPYQANIIKIILIIITGLFIINLACNIEKLTYVNEIFSLLGLIIFVIMTYKKILKHTLISTSVIFFLIYGTVYLITSLTDLNHIYIYLRQFVLIYSTLGFFLGIILLDYLYTFSNKFAISAVPIFILSILFGNTIATPALFPIIFNKYKSKAMLINMAIFCLYIKHHEATTIVMMILFNVLILANTYKPLKRLLINPTLVQASIFIFFTMMLLVDLYFNSFYLVKYAFFNFHYNDTTWRLMFWSYSFWHNFINHPLFGIGFGTPIFDKHNLLLHFIKQTNANKQLIFPYVLGTHNFFIYILSRLGIFGIAPILLIYISIVSHIKKHSLSNLSYSLLTSFLFISIGGLCNVVLPTPLYASTFWILLGSLYQSFKKDLSKYVN